MGTYNAAVGDETTQVKATIGALGSLEGLLDDLIIGELAFLNSQIDADDILPYDPASADIQMANLGVAHEALGQADGEGRSL